MKFVFADSLDLVDPSFDFESETRSPERIRQRDDIYAHEAFPIPPYDGLLVSKAIVDGAVGGAVAKYTMAQRQRLLREGVRRFFRIEAADLFTIGDCGAFTYVREPVPPFPVEAVSSFYEGCGFDFGISVDHVILAYDSSFDDGLSGINAAPAEWRDRQRLTLDLAADFMGCARRAGVRYHPVGVAQGWSPASYAAAVAELQRIGYDYIAIGGVVPLKTRDITAALHAVSRVRDTATRLHLLGVTRLEGLPDFERYGVVSFDSTSPLRQAFKDDRDNYHTIDGAYTALRVPQVEGNPSLLRKIRSGAIDLTKARRLEQACLAALTTYGRDARTLEQALSALMAYDDLVDGRHRYLEAYRRTLEDRPWEACGCPICDALGIHVVIFRGAERNRRRGFHNLHVLWEKLNCYRATRTAPPKESEWAQVAPHSTSTS